MHDFSFSLLNAFLQGYGADLIMRVSCGDPSSGYVPFFDWWRDHSADNEDPYLRNAREEAVDQYVNESWLGTLAAIEAGRLVVRGVGLVPEKVAALIKNFPFLRYLEVLGSCDVGLILECAAKYHAQSVHGLHVFHPAMDDSSFRVLANSILAFSRLEILDLTCLDLVYKDVEDRIIPAIAAHRSIRQLGLFGGNGFDKYVKDLKTGKFFCAKLLLARILIENPGIREVDNVVQWPISGVAASCGLLQAFDSPTIRCSLSGISNKKKRRKGEDGLQTRLEQEDILLLLRRNHRLRQSVIDSTFTLLLIWRQRPSSLIGLLPRGVLNIVIDMLLHDSLGDPAWLQCDRDSETTDLTLEHGLEERNYRIEERVEGATVLLLLAHRFDSHCLLKKLDEKTMLRIARMVYDSIADVTWMRRLNYPRFGHMPY